MIKKLVPLFVIIMFLSVEFAQAQQWRRERKEYVFGLGATNFLGELGGANQIGTNGMRDLDWPSTRPLGMFGYRYRLGKQCAAQGSLFVGFISGDDALTSDVTRHNRNLNFRSPVVELSGQFEFFLTRQREGHRYNLRGVNGWAVINVESYVFLGAGLAFINPQGRLPDGTWHNLQPLSTEGQGLVDTRDPYHRLQFVIPVGVGFKYAVSREWSIGLEYGMRKTFTDYMDDVSTTYYDNNEIRQEMGDMAAYFANPALPGTEPTQTVAGEQRGDPTDKDSYVFAQITLYYKIPRGGFAIPKF